MRVYKEELMEDILEEVKPLLEKHWEELANHKDSRPLNPDFEGYINLNKAGAVRIFTARVDDKLVGYICYAISHNLHYKDWKYAVCDVYFVDPNYRKSSIGVEMFVEAEKWLKEMGIQSTTAHVKVTHPHDELFQYLGYTLVERHYEKVL